MVNSFQQNICFDAYYEGDGGYLTPKWNVMFDSIMSGYVVSQSAKKQGEVYRISSET